MDAYLAASGRIYVLDTVRLWLLYMISKLFSLISDHVWLAFITEFLGSACERSGPHRGYTHLPTRGKLKALPKKTKKSSPDYFTHSFENCSKLKGNSTMFEVIWYTGRANIIILLDGAGGGNVILITILPYVVVCADYFFFRYFSLKNNDDGDDDDDDNARFPKLKW